MPYTPDNPYLPGDPYSYDLKWIVTQIQTCLDNYASLTTNFGTLQTNFDALYDYVHDYFNNLDISQEVEDKIEEMYNNGFFDNIINDWITDHNVLLVDTDQSGTFTDAEKTQGRANLMAGSSNDNLLDNPWWGLTEVVNQRGVSSGTAATQYFIDRWIADYVGTAGTYILNTDGISLTAPTGSTLVIRQVMEKPAKLNGKEITASVLLNNGIILTGTITRTTGTQQQIFLESGIGTRFLSNNAFELTLAATSITVRAIKLEAAPYSTLANDIAPDYATELAKCQRYFYGQKTTFASVPLAVGMAKNATDVLFTLPLPCNLYKQPQMPVFTGWVVSDATNDYPITLELAGTSLSGIVYLFARIGTSSLTTGQAVLIRSGSSGAEIQLSADL